MITLSDVIVLVNLVISLFLAYKVGTQQSDIETLYSGVAMTMDKLGMTHTEDE